MSSEVIHVSRQLVIAVWVAVITSVAALLLSGLSFIALLDDDDRDASVESRLVCLELPGPNDCGQDGR